MDKQFNKQDFEKLLRENANQYRMYPSEKVWTGVHAALHSRRKWYRISALSMLLLSGIAISLLVLNYSTDKKVTSELQQTTTTISTPLTPSRLFLEKNQPQSDQPALEKNSNLHTSAIQPSVKKEKLIPDYSEPVEEKINPGEFISPEFTNDADLAEDNIQNQSGDLITRLTISDNSPAEKILSENDYQKINDNSKITDAINALASLSIPVSVRSKKPGITTQFYLTPTVSYRKLTENNSSYATNSFSNFRYMDPNNIVNHKPAMGLEFGVEGKYKLNKKVSLKSGLQFNINRYDIRAYSSPTEIATVAVSSGYRTDYRSSLSNYRNFSGYNPNWLENFYFQAAIPVGIEFTIAQKNNLSWGVSGSIQPTYVIGDRAYMISSDYKNYAEFPDLMRRWNISTGFETFVTYSTGRVKWQTGPHVRYQHLSSYVSGYPLKENLFAVGLKVAASFNKK